jgi:hypothetical protein
MMRSSRTSYVVLGVILMAAPFSAQNVNLKHPDDVSAQKQVTPDEMRDRAAHVQLQKDAKELAGLCVSVSDDMGHVTQGMLSKDALEKLKRMEKLSKRVRDELAQIPATP